jgi:WD40 repeat protein
LTACLAAPAQLPAQQQAQQPAQPSPNVLSGHTQAVSAVALTPNGKIAASSSYDNTLKL